MRNTKESVIGVNPTYVTGCDNSVTSYISPMVLKSSIVRPRAGLTKNDSSVVTVWRTTSYSRPDGLNLVFDIHSTK